jgi:hypothetical protein
MTHSRALLRKIKDLEKRLDAKPDDHDRIRADLFKVAAKYAKAAPLDDEDETAPRLDPFFFSLGPAERAAAILAWFEARKAWSAQRERLTDETALRAWNPETVEHEETFPLECGKEAGQGEARDAIEAAP